MQEKIIQLESDGKKKAFELMMIFDDNNFKYAALSDIEKTDDVIIMKMIDIDDEYVFETIQNEEKAKELFVKFVSLWETEEESE